MIRFVIVGRGKRLGCVLQVRSDVAGRRHALQRMVKYLMQHKHFCLKTIRNPQSAIRNGRRGFTLIELLIVLAIIGLLVAIALPQYRNAQRKAQEAVLRENLARVRELLDQYKSDKGNYPQSLRTLVDEGYLRKMPVDPITKRSDTWKKSKRILAQIRIQPRSRCD